MQFGLALRDGMNSWRLQPTLRNKVELPPGLTDQELFKALPLGDIWRDAELPDVYFYLRCSSKPRIPASWEKAMHAFDLELGEQLHVA